MWKGECRLTDEIKEVIEKLGELPFLPTSRVQYMPKTEGYFFNLNLKDGLRLTISQYEADYGKGAYVNVMLDGKVLVQDRLLIEDIVDAVKAFYSKATE